MTSLKLSSALLASAVVLSISPSTEPTRLCRNPSVKGTSDRDVLFGTPARDVIAAGKGPDTVFALGGNDLICGGRGKDTLHGGDGSDMASGGRNSDLCIEVEVRRSCHE